MIPERFIWLKKLANIDTNEMLKTFNCGIGLIIIIDHKNKKDVINFSIQQLGNYQKLIKYF